MAFCIKETTMLSVMYSVLAVTPTTFAFAGYVLVSRH